MWLVSGESVYAAWAGVRFFDVCGRAFNRSVQRSVQFVRYSISSVPTPAGSALTIQARPL
jgi:hypothetical protein